MLPRIGKNRRGKLAARVAVDASRIDEELAVDILRKNQQDEHCRLRTLAAEGLNILEKARFPLTVESPPSRAPGVLCISLPWAKNMEDLIFYLNENHICVSRFSNRAREARVRADPRDRGQDLELDVRVIPRAGKNEKH